MIAMLNDLLWGRVLIFTLIPIGLYFTIRSGFVQFRYFGAMFAILGKGFRHHGDKPSSFQALTLSVAGRVGAGNIAGVAAAITLGGPGAIFWMWIVGLVGMATSFVECTLAQTYKQLESDGTYRGGPATYIRKGLTPMLGSGALILAGAFAVLLFATFGLAFVTVQSFVVSSSLKDAFQVPSMVTGFVLAGLIGLVIFGGVRRILAITEIVVPLMAVGYLALALFVVISQIDELPGVLRLIVFSAFGLEEAVGGAVGAALVQGIRRGLFSNEAGLGSGPNVAAVAYVPHPADQGMVQSLSVFIDTLVICTATASVILLSGIDYTDPTVDGVVLTQNALAVHVGSIGQTFVAVALTFFVFSSIMYNYFMGENALDYFAGAREGLFNIFRALCLCLIVVGSTLDLSTVFAFADVTMGMLALVNLFALVLLSPIAFRILADFDRQRRAHGTAVFDPDDFPDLDLDRKAWTLEPEDARRRDEMRKAT